MKQWSQVPVLLHCMRTYLEGIGFWIRVIWTTAFKVDIFWKVIIYNIILNTLPEYSRFSIPRSRSLHKKAHEQYYITQPFCIPHISDILPLPRPGVLVRSFFVCFFPFILIYILPNHSSCYAYAQLGLVLGSSCTSILLQPTAGHGITRSCWG